MDPAKLILAALFSALPDGGDPPSEILLIPAGTVAPRPHDPRPPWSNPDAAAVIAATRTLRLDLPIDYEHQGERAAANGQPAPAAGWIKELFERDGAIWGRVEWTAKAAAHITAREYRFVSPLFMHDNARRVRLVRGAALTNDPALFMPALARAGSHYQEGPVMDLKKLREALGLSADATEDQVLAAAKAARDALTAAAKALGLAAEATADQVTAAAKTATDGLTAVAKAAGLDGTAEPDAIATAVAAARAGGAGDDPDPTKFVPRAEFDRVNTRLSTLETDTASAKATAAVDAATAAGKIPPAQRDWYLAHAKRDLADFQSFVEGAPVLLEPGAITADPAPDKDAPLSADEMAACRAMGVTPEKFRESRKELTDAGLLGAG